MTTEKTPNYTDAQVEEMTTVFISAKTDAERAEAVENLANKFGRKVRSIRAKLSNLKVYIKPEKVTKAGAKIERKADIVGVIAKTMNADNEVMESIEKGTKKSLEMVRDFMLAQQAKIAELEEIINSDISTVE